MIKQLACDSANPLAAIPTRNTNELLFALSAPSAPGAEGLSLHHPGGKPIPAPVPLPAADTSHAEGCRVATGEGGAQAGTQQPFPQGDGVTHSM